MTQHKHKEGFCAVEHLFEVYTHSKAARVEYITDLGEKMISFVDQYLEQHQSAGDLEVEIAVQSVVKALRGVTNT